MPDRPEPAAAVILAAGAGSRFAGPGHKLTAALPGGATVLQRSVAAALASDVGEVVVVLGALTPAEADLPPRVTTLHHRGWEDGRASSLLVACRWAEDRSLGAVVVALGDQPGLTAQTWQRVAGATATPIALATYAGRRGHPVRLARTVWAELPTTGDEGARHLIRARPEWVTEVTGDGDPADIDTVADLSAWRTGPHRAADAARWSGRPPRAGAGEVPCET